MITVTIYKSTLDDTREIKRIEKSTTIKELFPDVDFTNSIISVNGYRQDENYLLADEDVCTIRLFPEGDAKDWLAGAIIGLLAGLTTVVTFGAALGVWAAVGVIAGGIAVGALGFGIASAAGWSICDWLSPDVPDMKSPDALEQIPQLRGAKNQSNIGKPVPLVLGKHLFTPMYVGNPYTVIDGVDGEDQYFFALYMLGYGKLRVTDVKLGVIGDLASNKFRRPDPETVYYEVDDGVLDIDGDPFLKDGNPKLELIQSERESDLYPQAVFEERLNIELSNPEEADPLNVVRFSARNPQKIQVEITLPSGLVGYNDKGDKINKSVEISAAWRRSRPDNSDNWKPFTRFGVDQENITEETVNNRLVSKITRAKTKQMRFIAEKQFTNYSEVSDVFDTRVIEIEIKRVNDQSNDTKTVDKVYLTAIRTWMFDNEMSKGGGLKAQAPVVQKLRDKTSRLAFKMKASQNTQGMLDALNCIVESKCRTYNKETNKWSDPGWDIKDQKWINNNESPSNNPAALALKLLQSPTMGRKAYPDSMLDMEKFGEFYQWCEERNYTCNGVLTAEKRLDEVLALVLSTGRAMRILNGNRYSLLIDQEREYPVMILNSQNVLEASNQKVFADLPDGFLIKYINEADGYQQTEEYVMKNGSNDPESIPESVIESIEIPYVTNHGQIVKIGWYLLACRLLRPEIWHRKLSIEGYLISIGDMVEVQDDTIVVGIGEGAMIKNLVIENNVITEIQTDGIFDVVDTTQRYGIKIMQLDGVHTIDRNTVRTIEVEIKEPGIYSNFPVKIPLNNTPIPSIGDVAAFGIYDKITTKALCFGKKDNGDGTFDVTLVPYQEGIYTTDSGEIPPYRANITTPQGMVPAPLPENVTISDVIDTVTNLELSGSDAVSYDLQPSVRIIVRESSGIFTPDRISCAQFMTAGNELPVPSNKMMQYVTSKSSEAVLYLPNTSILVSDWDWIEFILSDQGIELDRQRVPVLREGTDAVFLDLENQNYQIRCYYDGTPKEGQLPFTMQAVLFKGSSAADPVWTLSGAPRGITINQNGLISVNKEYKYIDDIPRYPSNTNLFDPMLGSFYPVSRKSKWLSGNTELEENNEITVKAYYNGMTYSRIFRIKKIMDGAPGKDGLDGKDGQDGKKGEQGVPAPKYLGLTENINTYNNVVIINGIEAYANEGDWVMRKSSATVYQWKTFEGRLQWVPIPRPTETERQNAAMYLLATTDLTDGAPMGIFSDMQARSLIAKTIFTKLLAAGEVELNDEYGLGGIIRSANYRTSGGVLGWMIDFLGNAIFNNITAKGHIDATSGKLDNVTIEKYALFLGEIISGPLELLNTAPMTQPIVYNIGTLSSIIILNELGRYFTNINFTYPYNNVPLGTNRYSISGTYGTTEINQIIFTTNRDYYGSYYRIRIWIYIRTNTGQEIQIGYYEKNVDRTTDNAITSKLSFNYTTGNKTLKLNNIPDYNTGIQGVVYRQGNQLMIT